MSWYERLIPSRIRKVTNRRVPEGLWKKCPSCLAVLYRPDLESNLEVCAQCGCHMSMSARKRLEVFLDPGMQSEVGADIAPTDFLQFKDKSRYKDRLSGAQKKTGENDALVVIEGRLKERPLAVCAFEFGFIGGSMGSVVGERFLLATRHCLEKQLPLVCFSASGGARMQEGLTSLLQMSKTSAALAQMAKHRLPFVSILTNPTMGGVSASLAMLGDVIICEPGALVGFAGPRVIRQTVGGELPEDFQRSEFLFKHGAVDMIVARKDMRDKVANILSLLKSR